MITTVLAMVALASATQDRVALVHDFRTDRTLAYDLTFTVKAPDGETTSKAKCEIRTIGSRPNGNIEIEMRLDDIKYVESDVEHTFKSAVFGFTVTKNGIPVNSVFDSLESLASASLIALFLPNKQMAEGESHNFKYDGDILKLKFKVVREGTEVLNDRSLIKLVSTGTISPSGEDVADFSLTSLYDAAAKRVAKAHAEIQLPWGDIVLDLVATN